MTLDRRTFIKSTGVGAASIAAGILPPAFRNNETPVTGSLDGPLPPDQIAYWHDHMIEFIEKNGILNYHPRMPEEPEWRVVEKGRMPLTLYMPYPHVLAKDVQHIKEDISHCAYSYSMVHTSFGSLRVDHFLKDTFNMAQSVHVNGGSFAILSVNGRHLGHAGYTTRPHDYDLNYAGIPMGDKVLKVWVPIKEHLKYHLVTYYLWETA